MSTTSREVLDFWFHSATSPEARMELWFGGAPETDAMIRERFEADVRAAAGGKYDDWRKDPESCLALILLLDQFSLNIYRDQAKSFEINAKALPFALEAIEKGFDQKVGTLERAFFYLPLEHAEDLAIQKKSVALFRKLGIEIFHHYAVLHLKVIERFGRFPDRNEILGRKSTPAEEKFLREEGSPF